MIRLSDTDPLVTAGVEAATRVQACLREFAARDWNARGVANVPQCKPTDEHPEGFDPIQYCQSILENNVVDSRHIPYYSGEQEPPKKFSTLGKEVWRAAWRRAESVMVESKEHWTLYGTRPTWEGKPTDYSLQVWEQYEKGANGEALSNPQ